MFAIVLHALLCLLPAALIAIPLLARRYPGERVLIALRRGARRTWARPGARVHSPRRVRRAAVSGGALIARSLAKRPPPVRALAS